MGKGSGAWMLHVASVFTPCCMLYAVVAKSLKPVKLLATGKQTQQFQELLANNVASVCTRLYMYNIKNIIIFVIHVI